MSETVPVERLRKQILETPEVRAAVRDHRQAPERGATREGPGVGDLVVLDAVADFGLEWLIVAQGEDLEMPGALRVVPADTGWLVGSRDVELPSDPATVDRGPLVVRCGHTAVVREASLAAAKRTGRLGPWDIERVQAVLHRLDRGDEDVGTLEAEETERDPEYVHWDEHLEQAVQALRFKASPVTESPVRAVPVTPSPLMAVPVPLRPLAAAREAAPVSTAGKRASTAVLANPQWSQRWLAAAASILLVVCLGQAVLLLNTPSRGVLPLHGWLSDDQYRAPDRIELGADDQVLRLGLPSLLPPERVETYHFRLTDTLDSAVVSSRTFPADTRRQLIELPVEDLSAGEYRWEIFGVAGDEETSLAWGSFELLLAADP